MRHPRQRTPWPVALVLVVAAFTLVATSPADTELTEELTFELSLADFSPVEVTLDVSGAVFEEEWRDPPMLRLTDVRRLGDAALVSGARVRLDPAVDTQRFVVWADDGFGPGWQVLPDACPDGCELSFVLSAEATSTADGAGDLHIAGELAARVEFEEGGFFSGAIPDGARLDLTVHDARFRPVPKPVLGLAPPERVDRGPDDLDDPSSTVRVDENAGVFTVTRTSDAFAYVVVDGEQLGATATLRPLSEGPTLAVAGGDAIQAPILDDCPPWPQNCVRDYVVIGLDGAITVEASGGARVEPGAAGNPILSIGDELREVATGTARVGPGAPAVLDHRIDVGPDVGDSSFAPDAGAVATVRLLDGEGRVLVRLGPAQRVFEADAGSVTVGTRLPGAYVDAPGPGDAYTAEVPFSVETLDDQGPVVEILWEVEVRVGTLALGRLDELRAVLSGVGEDVEDVDE